MFEISKVHDIGLQRYRKSDSLVKTEGLNAEILNVMTVSTLMCCKRLNKSLKLLCGLFRTASSFFRASVKQEELTKYLKNVASEEYFHIF